MQAPTSRYQNADFLRVIAAASVIFSHSFLIADGSEANEPFVRLLGDGNILGVYGVHVFFILSGFFVTVSISTSTSAWHFLWKRFLRIFPGLFICGLICSLVLGTIFTSMGKWDFLLSGIPFQYAAVNGIAPDYWYQIATVVFYSDHVPFNQILNGSLWTIPQELYCYVLVAALMLIGWLRRPVPFALVALAVAATYVAYPYLATSQLATRFIFVLPAFAMGMTIAFVIKSGPLDGRVAFLFALALIAVAVGRTHFGELFPLLAGYPVIYLATTSTLKLPSLRRIGDVSYGTYLYGWPIEQTVRAALGPAATWWEIFAIALPCALFAGWLSWHLLEKRALLFKDLPLIARWPKNQQAELADANVPPGGA